MFKHITQTSEQSFIIDFGKDINIEINNIVNLFTQIILTNSKIIDELNIKNVAPSFNKILIQFDTIYYNKSKILNFIKSIKVEKEEKNFINNILEIPICYDDIFSLDFKDIEKKTGLKRNEIINEHLKTIFHVYMIGFLPGLPFMGNMDDRLSLSRKDSPRLKVPKGSVGIVDNLCVIYPQESPGGWNIIGRTPINLFNKKKKESLVLNPGDKIKFKQISAKIYSEYK